MKNYKQTASDVLRLVGGEKNVTHLEHCITRLRFTLADPSKANVAELKKTPGVMGVVASGPQCQVVIGNDIVEVYNEVMKLGTFQSGTTAPKNNTDKKNYGAIALDFIVAVFSPLVPAIAGAGMIKAILTLCTTFGLLTSDATSYKILYYVADATLYYLPLLVAVNTASKLNCNKLVSLATVAALVYPNTITLLGMEGGATILGFTLQNISYSYQVFPPILIVGFIAIIEKWVTKYTPKPICIFFVPMVCFLVAFPVSLLVLGPLGYNIGTILSNLIVAMFDTFGWIAVGILGALLPFMVAAGAHKAMNPYAISALTGLGYEMLYLPASLAHNIAECGACAAVAIRSKNMDTRATASSAAISALFGITEPALYGITLQNRRVTIGVCSGGLLAGFFLGLMKLKGFAAVAAGLASMAAFVDPDNSMNIVWAFVGFAIALITAFIITLVIYKDDDASSENNAKASDASENVSSTVLSPVDGSVLPLTQVNDTVFSQEILGPGIAVKPKTGKVYAPADGVVKNIFDTAHAISMETTTGAEILIHIGIDTVKLDGKGFQPHVKNGDSVKKGQLLIEFNLDQIEKEGYDSTVMIVITNAERFDILPSPADTVAPGSALLYLKSKKQ